MAPLECRSLWRAENRPTRSSPPPRRCPPDQAGCRWESRYPSRRDKSRAESRRMGSTSRYRGRRSAPENRPLPRRPCRSPARAPSAPRPTAPAGPAIASPSPQRHFRRPPPPNSARTRCRCRPDTWRTPKPGRQTLEAMIMRSAAIRATEYAEAHRCPSAPPMHTPPPAGKFLCEQRNCWPTRWPAEVHHAAGVLACHAGVAELPVPVLEKYLRFISSPLALKKTWRFFSGNSA